MPVYVAILPDYINNEETRHANRQAALKDLARGHAMGNSEWDSHLSGSEISDICMCSPSF